MLPTIMCAVSISMYSAGVELTYTAVQNHKVFLFSILVNLTKLHQTISKITKKFDERLKRIYELVKCFEKVYGQKFLEQGI